MIITDVRIIINTDVDSYIEEHSFIISDLQWIAISSKKSKSMLLCVKHQGTHYLSLKRRNDALTLIKILYFRLNKVAPLDVYQIPKKDLSQYEVTIEEAENDEYGPPNKKYLYHEQEDKDIK